MDSPFLEILLCTLSKVEVASTLQAASFCCWRFRDNT